MVCSGTGSRTALCLNKKAYDALPVDLRRTLDHAVTATQVYGLMEYEANNAIALGKLKNEFKDKVEILQLPGPVLRDLKKLAAEVVREESEKTPMARKVYASFTRFQAKLAGWARISEGAYHHSSRCEKDEDRATPIRARAMGHRRRPDPGSHRSYNSYKRRGGNHGRGGCSGAEESADLLPATGQEGGRGHRH
jgi:hypothetical protein